MTAYQCRSSAWTLFIAVAFCAVAPALAQGQQPTRDQQIDELRKRIEALDRKLDELKKMPTTQPVPPAAPTPATPPDGLLDPAWVKSLNWRSIGPAAMGGRITDISVAETDPNIYFVATASGGLLKTVNNGVTFVHQFDRESTVSIGAVCVAPSDANVVWVGTGEGNPRNSVSFGDGVYKSVDGGKIWKNMGLKKTFQIGRIVIHPRNPNIVYVGALGRLYGPNPERGVFKTSNGGETWDRVLYIDDRTGIIDMRMNPADPETLLVAAYERLRDGFDSHPGAFALPEGYDIYDPIKKWGVGAGIYKTSDGGKNFKKLTRGLPTCELGRIGLDFYRKDPKTVFAIIESEKIGMAPAPQGAGQAEAFLGATGADADAGGRINAVVPDSPAARAGLQKDDIVLAVDSKPVLSFDQLVEQVRLKKPGDKITLRLARKREAKDLVVTLARRPPAATQETPRRPFGFWYGGQRENVQDKQGPDGFQYGGVYKSSDGGESWTRINSVNPRPMYFSQIRVDPTDEQHIYVLGIDLYRSKDGGKTFTPDGNRKVHPDQHALWIDPKDGRHMIVGCDGGFYVTYDRMENWDYLNTMAIGQFYHVSIDNRRPYNVYGGLQDNGSWGGPHRTLRNEGPINEDWIFVSGGDGFVCRVDQQDPDLVYFESQDGGIGRRNLRTGQFWSIHPVPPPTPRYSINWNAPFLVTLGPAPLVPFVPNLVRQAYPYRFNWNTPFILSQHNARIFYSGGNHVFRSVSQGADLRPISPEITRTGTGTATALAESPRNPLVLYAGTDDGYLWVTRDGGTQWTNVTAKVGLPGPRWVASIECSHFVEGRAYVVFDAHRSNDDEPYVYVTEDFGQTWNSLRSNLPTGSTRVLREDTENADLLFLGTEFAVWTSLNRGVTWTRLNNNLPTVAVHELAIHPTTGDMVAATHGRSLWILNIVPLRQMTAEALKAKVHLYQPAAVVRWHQQPDRFTVYGIGARHFIGDNPPAGAQIYYSLTKKAEKISLKVVDFAGKTVQELPAPADPGLHVIPWYLVRRSGSPPNQANPQAFVGGQPVNPGMYRIILTVDGDEQAQNFQLEADPTVTAPASSEQESSSTKEDPDKR